MTITARSRGRRPAVGHLSLEAPFVGRAAELETLLGALDDAVARRTPALRPARRCGRHRQEPPRPGVPVAGPVARVERRRSSRVAARRRAAASSYWALGEVLRRASGIGLDDRAAGRRDAAPRRPRPDSRAARAERGGVAGDAPRARDVGRDRHPGQPARARRTAGRPAAITHAWARLLSAHTRRGGAILVIEDLHWAGSALIVGPAGDREPARWPVPARRDRPSRRSSAARSGFMADSRSRR